MLGRLRILFLCQIISNVYAGSTTEGHDRDEFEFGKQYRVGPVPRRVEAEPAPNESSSFLENSIAADEDSSKADFVARMCYLFPNVCSNLEAAKHRFLMAGVSEARGPKDLIAIISTMLATLLGAILVKLNVLIVLSLISVGIGKLLLLILALKSQIFGHKNHQQQAPVVYEKIYYPTHQHHHPLHKEYFSELPQTYNEDYQTYS